MNTSRRTFLTAAAALAITPDTAFAARAMRAASDWSLATADVEGDIAPRVLQRVHGRVPEGLSGALYRNGPAKFRRPGGSSQHWFDGDGLIRRFGIHDGQATLAARFADTPKRRQETRLDAMVMPGFGTAADPRAEIGSVDDANPANTSVHRVGDAIWALWEAGSPMAMDPDTLETRGFVTLRPDLKSMPFLAHPRIEPDGRIWNLGLNGNQAVVWRLAADGTLEDARVIPLPRASYIHDFTATARHLVIVLQPWVHARNVMPVSTAYDWLPDQGTQVLVIDKDDLDARRVYEAPAFGFFHLGDAWEESDGTIRSGVQGEERAGKAGENRGDAIRRYSLHTLGEQADRPLATAVGVTDWDQGRTHGYDFGAGHVVDEMVHVPKPGMSGEADAWLVGPTINLREGVTELHVLDMARVEDGPVCTWRADVALPAAFHGNWAAA